MTLETVSKKDEIHPDRPDRLAAAMLRPGQVFGGRFEAVALLSEDSLGARLSAKDNKTIPLSKLRSTTEPTE